MGGPRAPQPFLRLHRKEPDYTRPLLNLSEEERSRILGLLASLYGTERAEGVFPELERLMQVHYAHKTPDMIDDDKAFDPAERFTEKDVILITYGDAIRSPGKRPLEALSDLVTVFFRRLVNTIHILPFFPYSSDRGFSVTDFEEVDPRLGNWDDIDNLSLDFKLMFDGVVNHVSSKSRWFQKFLNGNPEFRDYFITFSTQDAIGDDHLKLILRPRTSPLLTAFHTLDGPKYVWTTFSPDQVDLNYKNEKVLLRVVEILLRYVRHGADIIRLDAVTYLWHELGTSCAHLQQTHLVVRLLRAILDVVAPHLALLTETNVPHEENITYFGDGTNEAQIIYNFALPPLVLHAFLTGSCRRLREWAAALDYVSDTATYFNFLDSHDGVALLPVKNILTPEEVGFLAEKAQERGGLVSYRDAGDGTQVPYELNITWFSALNKPISPESVDLQVDRFVASRAISLVLQGVPGVYLPSLVGGENDQEGVLRTGEARNINRSVIDERMLIERLGDSDSVFHKVARKYFLLLEKRTEIRAFHPNSRQAVLSIEDSVFSVLRTARDGSELILALVNVTSSEQELRLNRETLPLDHRPWVDRLSGAVYRTNGDAIRIGLQPYQVLWLSPEQEQAV